MRLGRLVELAVDGAPPVVIAPHTRVVLHVAPGAPLVLAARQGRLALFRPADGARWQVHRLEGVAAEGQRVQLPGGLRSSDSFEVAGDVELRELRLDHGELAVAGALRRWSGEVGRAGEWDAVAPWPPSSYCGFAAAALVVLVLAALVHARLRWRAWERELG